MIKFSPLRRRGENKYICKREGNLVVYMRLDKSMDRYILNPHINVYRNNFSGMRVKLSKRFHKMSK